MEEQVKQLPDEREACVCDVTDHNEDYNPEKELVGKKNKEELLYKVDDTPAWYLNILFALQVS